MEEVIPFEPEENTSSWNPPEDSFSDSLVKERYGQQHQDLDIPEYDPKLDQQFLEQERKSKLDKKVSFFSSKLDWNSFIGTKCVQTKKKVSPHDNEGEITGRLEDPPTGMGPKEEAK